MKRIITIIALISICGISKAQTFSWSGFTAVMDFETDTIPITVSGLPSAINMTLGLAHVCMNITHTYKADLYMRLVSPSGTSVNMIDNTGGAENNFLGTCLGMDGTSWSNSQAPYTGLFLPAGDINAFNNGQNPNGTWLFIVSDQAGADTGSVHDVSLAFVNNPPGSGGGEPTGEYVCSTCVCEGGAVACDLLPDVTSSAKEINVNHNEVPGALYISNATPNIGFGPLDVYGIDSCFCGTTYVPCGTVCPGGENIKHAVKQRIYQKVAGTSNLTYYDRLAGRMTYHATHGHIHVDNWAHYTLRTATSNPDATTWPIIGTGVKESFCLINLGTCAGNNGECLDNNGNVITTVPNQNFGFHTGCGMHQGIYPGNYDVYSISLNDPIPLVNVCNGQYYIVSITDPDNNFLESDETNNWVAVPITLTQQNATPVITPSGPTEFCQGGSVTLTSNSASNYVWSTGETTQSIVVNSTGSYTVSTNCGTSVTTSNPVNVNVVQLNVTGSATPAAVGCNGDQVQLNSSAPTSGTQNVPVTFTSNQVVAIPDNNATGVTSAITVSGITPATLTGSSIISVRINITHTYDGDLLISLISPSGNSIVLSQRRGGSGANFVNTVFTMSAATLISAGSAPFTGNFKPDGNFANLAGNANGTWLLKVQDLAGQDVGNITNWRIIINKVVPETLSYAWSSTPPGYSSTIQNPLVTPTSSASYHVTVTSSANGCLGTKTIPVTVPDEVTVNNFTPSTGSGGSTVNIYGTGFTGATTLTIAGLASSFSIIDGSHIQATVPNSPQANGLICVDNINNCGSCSNTNFTISTSSQTSLNLKLYIQGFYLGNGVMNSTVDPLAYPGLCDSITSELHHAFPPYALAHSTKGTIDIFGNGTFVFPSSVAGGSYFVVVHHRNSLVTWSKNPVLFSDLTNYDYTTSSTMAYDDGFNLPMIQVDNNPARWAIFNGDLNRDGGVDALDMTDAENATNTGYFGYQITDVTGDLASDALDMTVIENNMSQGVFEAHP